MSCPHCTGRTGSSYRLDDRCEAHRDEPVQPGRIGQCEQCEATFACDAYVWATGRRTPVRFCSEDCRQRAAIERRRDSGARRVPPTTKTCERCGETFTAARSDARYCSGRCRVAVHRTGS